MSTNTPSERELMTCFWEEHSKAASQEEMMLDSKAELLTRHDVPEILSLLPDFRCKSVLEIGAGIGRFTGCIAETCESITAVDFMESFIEKNKELNSRHKNINYLVADATKLDIPDKSVDIVFTNWLLMYFTDEEVASFFNKALKWLKDDGVFFFRESCFHQSGDANRTTNPTKYRDPLSYLAFSNNATLERRNGLLGSYGFELVMSKNVETYVKFKSNRNQICWLVKKIFRPDTDKASFKTFQEFLDQQQYTRNGILRYERIFGEHFISTGGKETTEEYVAKLDLKPGQKVLDVGAGVGGSAFYMSQTYGAHVLGIDLSYNMVNLAWEKLKKLQLSNVTFLAADATAYDFPEASFDVVYSRDTILHIPDKTALFTRFLRWLKPGGKLLITDYCCSDGEHSVAFQDYVKQRGYILLSPNQYGKVLEEVGFSKVEAYDKTDTFVECLNTELSRTESIKDSFIQEFSQTDYDAIVNGWRDKLVRCSWGDQRWGLFFARKPSN